MKQWFSRYWMAGKKGQVILERQETNEVSPAIAPAWCLGRVSKTRLGRGIQMEPSKHLEVRWSWFSKEATVAGVSRQRTGEESAVQSSRDLQRVPSIVS